jgi:ribonuclease BN (tRNA processing enzyme)
MTADETGIHVTVLGSSGSYASSDNPCSGYLVRTPEAAVVLDCGPGTLGPLQREIDLEAVSAFVLTHCHPDHWLELPVIRNVFIWFVVREHVPVYGTQETRDLDAAVTVRTLDQPDPFDWHVIDADAELTIADQRWTFSKTDHTVETLAVRVDSGGRSFAFSSDSGPAWGFESLGPGIDLALCDASHPQELEGQGIPHMSAREAGAAGRAANVGRLVITHVIPGADRDLQIRQAAAAFGRPVEIALAGSRFRV